MKVITRIKSGLTVVIAPPPQPQLNQPSGPTYVAGGSPNDPGMEDGGPIIIIRQF